MSRFMTLSLAASVGALAVAWGTVQSAKAADLPMPQAQIQAPGPGYYGPPPVEESYAYPPPPPFVYGYPPPPVAYYAYAAPRFAVWPGPSYYGRGPYWRGYGPRFAYGYGRRGRGYRR